MGSVNYRDNFEWLTHGGRMTLATSTRGLYSASFRRISGVMRGKREGGPGERSDPVRQIQPEAHELVILRELDSTGKDRGITRTYLPGHSG